MEFPSKWVKSRKFKIMGQNSQISTDKNETQKNVATNLTFNAIFLLLNL